MGQGFMKKWEKNINKPVDIEQNFESYIILCEKAHLYNHWKRPDSKHPLQFLSLWKKWPTYFQLLLKIPCKAIFMLFGI